MKPNLIIAAQKLKAQESDSEIVIEPNKNVRGDWLNQYQPRKVSAEPEVSPVRVEESPAKSPYASHNRTKYHEMLKNTEELSSQYEKSVTPKKADQVVMIDDSPVHESPYGVSNDFIVREKQQLFNETKPSYYDNVGNLI